MAAKSSTPLPIPTPPFVCKLGEDVYLAYRNKFAYAYKKDGHNYHVVVANEVTSKGPIAMFWDVLVQGGEFVVVPERIYGPDISHFIEEVKKNLEVITSKIVAPTGDKSVAVAVSTVRETPLPQAQPEKKTPLWTVPQQPPSVKVAVSEAAQAKTTGEVQITDARTNVWPRYDQVDVAPIVIVDEPRFVYLDPLKQAAAEQKAVVSHEKDIVKTGDRAVQRTKGRQAIAVETMLLAFKIDAPRAPVAGWVDASDFVASLIPEKDRKVLISDDLLQVLSSEPLRPEPTQQVAGVDIMANIFKTQKLQKMLALSGAALQSDGTLKVKAAKVYAVLPTTMYKKKPYSAVCLIFLALDKPLTEEYVAKMYGVYRVVKNLLDRNMKTCMCTVCVLRYKNYNMELVRVDVKQWSPHISSAVFDDDTLTRTSAKPTAVSVAITSPQRMSSPEPKPARKVAKKKTSPSDPPTQANNLLDPSTHSPQQSQVVLGQWGSGENTGW